MTRVLFTYADYAALPADGRRYEIHEGELAATPAPGTRHQRVKINIFAILLRHVREGRLGELFDAPTDVILSDTTVVQPDILFVEPQRAGQITERGIEGPPTLVVEVLSPSSERIDREGKLALYARHGVPYYWIVDPVARVVEAFALGGGRYAVAARLAGGRPATLPPFDDLPLDPAAVWP